MNPLLGLMGGISFFDAFASEEKRLLAESGNFFEQFQSGDVIIQEGDLLDSSLFVILSGTAFVRKDDYPDNIIAYLETGSIIGEAAFLVGGRRRMASVVADGSVTVFKLDRAAMESFSCPFQLKITSQLVVIIVDRLEKMNEALAELMG